MQLLIINENGAKLKTKTDQKKIQTAIYFYLSHWHAFLFFQRKHNICLFHFSSRIKCLIISKHFFNHFAFKVDTKGNKFEPCRGNCYILLENKMPLAFVEPIFNFFWLLCCQSHTFLTLGCFPYEIEYGDFIEQGKKKIKKNQNQNHFHRRLKNDLK